MSNLAEGILTCRLIIS